MTEYIRITDRKIELTDEGVENLVSEYTPTTEEVRDAFSDYKENDAGGWFKAEAGFDRWLAEVKAQVWEEGYAHGNADAFTEARLDRDNPYLQEKGSGNSSSQPTAETSNLLNKQDDK